MVLPVDVTRLCPDCDVLTESLICPLCGRDRTFPVAAWLSPLEAARPLAIARSAFHVRRDLIGRRPADRRSASRMARLGDRAS
jgi:hypothetical protein